VVHKSFVVYGRPNFVLHSRCVVFCLFQIHWGCLLIERPAFYFSILINNTILTSSPQKMSTMFWRRTIRHFMHFEFRKVFEFRKDIKAPEAATKNLWRYNGMYGMAASVSVGSTNSILAKLTSQWPPVREDSGNWTTTSWGGVESDPRQTIKNWNENFILLRLMSMKHLHRFEKVNGHGVWVQHHFRKKTRHNFWDTICKKYPQKNRVWKGSHTSPTIPHLTLPPHLNHSFRSLEHFLVARIQEILMRSKLLLWILLKASFLL